MAEKRTGRRLTWIVTPQRDGQKVDTVLRRELGLSGTVVRRVKWLPDGILLDGQRVYTSQRVRIGQELSVLVGEAALRSGLTPAPGPLDIVYEDEDLLVVNKAPGVPSHTGPGHYNDTLGNFLMNYYRKQGVFADYHPVHRLDKGTSGLMVVAKHPHAQERLKEQLHTGAFRRIYLAVCEGRPEPEAGVVDAPIGRVEGSLLAVRPDPLPGAADRGGPGPAAAGAGDGTYSPDPGPHGPSRAPPYRRFPLRDRGYGADPPARPPLGGAGAGAAPDRGAHPALRPSAGRYGAAFALIRRQRQVPLPPFSDTGPRPPPSACPARCPEGSPGRRKRPRRSGRGRAPASPAPRR